VLISDWASNGTSVQLGYTVPFMLNKRQIKKKQKILILNTTQNTAKQNKPGVVAFYDTQPGNEVGLLYKAPKQLSQ